MTKVTTVGNKTTIEIPSEFAKHIANGDSMATSHINNISRCIKESLGDYLNKQITITDVSQVEYDTLVGIAKRINQPNVINYNQGDRYVSTNNGTDRFRVNPAKKEGYMVKLKGLSVTAICADDMQIEAGFYSFYKDLKLIASFPKENVEYAGKGAFIRHFKQPELS